MFYLATWVSAARRANVIARILNFLKNLRRGFGYCSTCHNEIGTNKDCPECNQYDVENQIFQI
ncbi:hypothetical protein AciPR4_0153 [Terriglobus saanensis SP1PR4]|uniref:Uncharacterized protein n=1 Tax=Terriglobus saanensis (strain ATCC BAA-1853 / DSM 23119 / SP1PR4) TaxID=401053 RepID=E8UZ47_TERSS|nr:hypothetical protein AciPR4_0153 [Terriglobus saanensis SP1PR4]